MTGVEATELLDAVVIGGGVAGLVAARELALTGIRPLVLESWRTAGGAVGRHTVAGLVLDAGAESFATRGGTVAALVTELGLADSLTSPSGAGAWVQLPSGPGTLPRTGLLGVPADPWAVDVRRTIGLLGALRAGADRWLPAARGTVARDGSPATFGELVRARMGRRVLDRLVTPVVSGVHAADPRDLDVDAIAPGLRAALAARGSLGAAVGSLRALAPAGTAVAGLTGGMFRLVDALTADIEARGGRIETDARVTAIERAPAGGTGAGWLIRVAATGTGERIVRARRLVLALPGPAAADLLAPHLPGPVTARPAAGADVVLATLVLAAPELDGAPRGTGVLVAPGVAGVRARALTHASAKWAWLAAASGPGRHVVRLSYGSTAWDLPAAELTALALRDAGFLLGVPLDATQVTGSARVRWSQSLPQPSPAQRAVVAGVRAGAAALPDLAVCGAWLAGNGLAAVVADARVAGRRLAAEAFD